MNNHINAMEVEAVAAALEPKLWDEDGHVAHMAASPNDVEHARHATRLKARDAINAFLQQRRK